MASDTFTVGDLTAVVGDNAAAGTHRAGYNGLWSLTHRTEPVNLFVPTVAGLNFEHIFDGDRIDKDKTQRVFFEPRHAPMNFRRLSATEALHCGLIGAVYPHDELSAAADAIIDRLRGGPAVALAKTKQAINAATLGGLDGALARECAGQDILLKSADVREGKLAFQQKREPVFSDVPTSI